MAGTPPGCDRPLASATRGDASRTNRTYVYLTCPWNVYSDHGAGAKCLILLGAPEGIRTSDLCLRRATLYPAELRALRAIQYPIDGPGATGAGRKPGRSPCYIGATWGAGVLIRERRHRREALAGFWKPTVAPSPRRQSAIADSESSQGFGSIFLSTGARQGDAGPLGIHAAFIHKSAIHSPKKVQ
jgi:hypothetical protein